jgi:hypothetical protein
MASQRARLNAAPKPWAAAARRWLSSMSRKLGAPMVATGMTIVRLPCDQLHHQTRRRRR